MNMFKRFFSAYKGGGAAHGFEEAFRDTASEEMRKAVLLWYGLYYDFAGDYGGLDPAQRIPFVIVDGLYKAVFGEYEANASDTAEFSALQPSLDSFDKIRPAAFQQACIGGEAFIKPLVKRDRFAFTVIGRGNMIVLGRDAEGNITDLVTGALTVKGSDCYWLSERRTLGADGLCTVQNKLYRSDSKDMIGRPVPLSALPEYAELPPAFTFPESLDGLGLIPVKIPSVNCVDGSPDGVSVYAAAVREILKLYKHEVRTQDEYDLTAPHMVASADIQRRGKDGSLIEIPKYITPLMDEDPRDAGLTVWNPKPNQAELEARDDQIKRAIENIIGLRRGFLSKSDTREITATEILSTTTKMAYLVKDLQRMWDGAVQETARVCSVLARIYGIPWAGCEVTTHWGDGILYDEEKAFTRLSLMVAQGSLKPEYLVDWMKIKPLDPKRVAEIREQIIPAEKSKVSQRTIE